MSRKPTRRSLKIAAPLALSVLMVSTVRFRSLKDVRLNVRTVLFVAFAIGSSAIISAHMKPAFVLVWLLGFYVMVGIFETLWALSGRFVGAPLRGRLARSRNAWSRPSDSVPPTANGPGSGRDSHA